MVLEHYSENYSQSYPHFLWKKFSSSLRRNFLSQSICHATPLGGYLFPPGFKHKLARSKNLHGELFLINRLINTHSYAEMYFIPLILQGKSGYSLQS